MPHSFPGEKSTYGSLRYYWAPQHCTQVEPQCRWWPPWPRATSTGARRRLAQSCRPSSGATHSPRSSEVTWATVLELNVYSLVLGSVGVSLRYAYVLKKWKICRRLNIPKLSLNSLCDLSNTHNFPAKILLRKGKRHWKVNFTNEEDMFQLSNKDSLFLID